MSIRVLIKVVTGMRRCGKSYLLFNIFKEYLVNEGVNENHITEFRGRGDEVHMYSLTYSEFMSAYDGDKQEGWRDYVLFGGIPLVLGFETADQKSDFIKSLFEETYISDITGRNNIRNKAELEEH